MSTIEKVVSQERRRREFRPLVSGIRR
jgi:hypothetical protein